MINYECPYCGNIMTELHDVCPDCGAQNGEFKKIQAPDPVNGSSGPEFINQFQEIPRGYFYKSTSSKEDSYAIVSLVLAIAGNLMNCAGLGWIAAIVALIFGIMGLKSRRLHTLAVVGIVLSLISIVFGAIVVIMAVLSLI